MEAVGEEILEYLTDALGLSRIYSTGVVSCDLHPPCLLWPGGAGCAPLLAQAPGNSPHFHCGTGLLEHHVHCHFLAGDGADLFHIKMRDFSPGLLILHLGGKDLLGEGAQGLVHICKEEFSVPQRGDSQPLEQAGAPCRQFRAQLPFPRGPHTLEKTLSHLPDLQQGWATPGWLET